MKIIAWTIILILTITIATATNIPLINEPTINNSIAQNNEYTATYANTPTSGNTVTFTRQGISIGLQPHSLNWNNQLSQLQQINMPQNVQRTQNNNDYEYQNAYGAGISLIYENKWYGVKELLVINSYESLGIIESYVINGGNPYLEANFLLTTNAQHIIVEGAEWDKSSQTTTDKDILIKNDQGTTIYYLPRPIAIDNDGKSINGTYKLKKSSNKLYIGITIPQSWLSTAAYPVIIDPSFYVDYNPAPATLYSGGDNTASTYASFSTTTDITTTQTDGITSTYSTISNSPAANDVVIRLKWTHTYQTGYDYFLRIYKNNAQTVTMRIYPHNTNDTINTTYYKEQSMVGAGFFNINITEYLSYMKNINLGNTQLRLITLSTTENIQVGESMLRQELDDNAAPTVTYCQTNTSQISCEQSVLFSCTISDGIDVSYATFTINEDELLADRNNNLFSYIYEPTGYGEYDINLTNVYACDIFNNCNNTAQTISTHYNCTLQCDEDWTEQYDYYEPCQTNNTRRALLYYTDDNDCGTFDDIPIDNNTNITLYCNYCDPDWVLLTGGIHDCQENETKYIEYYDYNGCYDQTGLLEDEPPNDHETWVSCDYIEKEFYCDFNENPYDTKKIEYSCELPYNSIEWECVNKVTKYPEGDIYQTNPQTTSRTNSFLFSKEYEERETFTTTLGLLNAYYRKDNILANNDFKVTTTCTDGTNRLRHEQLVRPEKKDLHGVANWGVWSANNMTYLALVFIVLIIAAFIIGSVIRELRRR